jgi:hypothetical protein
VLAALKEKDLWPSGNGNPGKTWGLTLQELADAKRLPVESIKKWGVANINYKGRTAVYIPYRDLEGKTTDRFRLNLKQEPRLIWRKGAKTLLYGLWRLPEFQQAGELLLVEGETDCWTLWEYGIPALGLPGKTNWKSDWAAYLKGLKVYLWQEPDAPELPGKIARDLPGLLVIKAPADFKDISEAHVAGQDVVALIDRLKGEASPPETPLKPKPQTAWQLAPRLFPRIPFPWEVLPSDIADSLQQLGRACATSSTALPGAAFCLMGSVMGRSRVVSPKKSWDAPLIIWHLDMRESGDGKTAPVRLMARPIHEAQREEEKRYEEEVEVYNKLPKKDRDKTPPPVPPRGYFVTDLTLEGLREDLVHSPHGGIVVIQDEISAFLTGQNQYKQKGTDREAWLALHDGHPARVRRVGRSLFINGARVSVFGGIQPKVFRTFFAGEDGLYLSDGTLFRFLVTCEPPTYYELTEESWEDRDRDIWETLLHRAIKWVEEEIYARGGKIEKPARMILNSDAQENFLEWRNQLQSFRDRLPLQLRGFLPKAYEYCLRLTGVIHCMHQFSIGKTPQAILTADDLERGMKTVHFYLGQVQDALRLIEDEDHSPVEISERSILLARTLKQLRPSLENGRLAIGFIHEQFNKIAPKTQRIGKPRGMGALLRSVKLTISPDKHDANGRRAAYCLEWNQETENFIKQCLQYLQSLQTHEWQGFEDADIKTVMSASSSSSTDRDESVQTLKTPDNQCLHPETRTSNQDATIADIADENVREVQI